VDLTRRWWFWATDDLCRTYGAFRDYVRYPDLAVGANLCRAYGAGAWRMARGGFGGEAPDARKRRAAMEFKNGQSGDWRSQGKLARMGFACAKDLRWG